MAETGFNVKTGLLEPTHRKQIGIALWEFLWCIDRITKEYSDPEGKWGLVLGGKPIEGNEIAEALGTHPETVKKNLRKLTTYGYLRLKRTPYGNIIEVAKSGKWRPKVEKVIHPELDQVETGSGGPSPVEVPNSNPDRMPSPEGMPFPNDLKEICDHLAAKMTRLDVGIKDVTAIKSILNEPGMTKEIIITGIDKSFTGFKPEYEGDKIRSFSYCEPLIREEHKRTQILNGKDAPPKGKRGKPKPKAESPPENDKFRLLHWGKMGGT